MDGKKICPSSSAGSLDNHIFGLPKFNTSGSRSAAERTAAQPVNPREPVPVEGPEGDTLTSRKNGIRVLFCPGVPVCLDAPGGQCPNIIGRLVFRQSLDWFCKNCEYRRGEKS